MNVVNFRDLGGISNVHGQTVRSGKLLRSGQLVGLDEDSRRALARDYHVTHIVDFRRPAEIAEQPEDHIEGAHYTNIDLLGQTGTKNVSLDDLASLGYVDKVDDHMRGTYRDLVLNPGAQQGYAQFLDIVLANQSGATDFHCFAGKDRTGYAAALVLWLLEVDDEEVMRDYLQTNEDRVEANNEILDQFRGNGFNQDALDALAVALYVKDEYLLSAKALMEDTYGDVFSYAEQALGFGSDKVEELRDTLLEG